MPDALNELLSFAQEVLATVPGSQSGSTVIDWQRTARHFCSVCMVENRLERELQSRLSVRDRGPFLDSLRVVHTGANLYQGQSEELRKHLTVIVDLLTKIGSASAIDGLWFHADDAESLDGGTRLSTKKHFDRDFLLAIKSASPGLPISLLFLDVDDFKAINTNHGHSGGDAALAGVATELMNIAAGKGKAYRYGGDEFAVLLRNTDAGEAAATAQRLLVALAGKEFAPGLRITLSIGVAACEEATKDPKLLFDEADKQLYRSKDEGKGRVSAATIDSGTPSRPSRLPIYEAPSPQTLRFGGRFPADAFKLTEGDSAQTLQLPEAAYLHLWLSSSMGPTVSSKAIRDGIRKSALKPMGGELLGSVSDRNTLGGFVCRHENGRITHLSQVHNNGEVFGLDFESLNKERHMKRAGIDFGIVPTGRVERVFTETLRDYLHFARTFLKLTPPLSFMLGLNGIAGFRLAVSAELHGSQYIGRALHDSIALPVQVRTYEDALPQLLRPFFVHVWDEFGEERP